MSSDGLWFRSRVDSMVEKARVARESQAMGTGIALNSIAAAMICIQLTQKHISGMSIEYGC